VPVVTAQPVSYRRYQGYADPRFPEGFWFSKVTATGDASGNPMTLTHILADGSNPLSSRIWSLEQVALRVSVAQARQDIIRMGGLRDPTLTGTLQVEWILQRIAPDVGAFSGWQARDMAFLPVHLGGQRVGGTSAFVEVDTINENGAVHVFYATGYWWGARSVLADGGPQRPLTGIFPA